MGIIPEILQEDTDVVVKLPGVLDPSWTPLERIVKGVADKQGYKLSVR